MTVTITSDEFPRMFNLGVELWFPKKNTWKRFQINFLLGPYSLCFTFGSTAEYEKDCGLLRGHP